jgi:hypothetical protein
MLFGSMLSGALYSAHSKLPMPRDRQTPGQQNAFGFRHPANYHHSTRKGNLKAHQIYGNTEGHLQVGHYKWQFAIFDLAMPSSHHWPQLAGLGYRVPLMVRWKSRMQPLSNPSTALQRIPGVATTPEPWRFREESVAPPPLNACVVISWRLDKPVQAREKTMAGDSPHDKQARASRDMVAVAALGGQFKRCWAAGFNLNS